MIPFASGDIILVKGLVCKIGILGHLHVFLQMLGSHGVLRVSQGLIPDPKSTKKRVWARHTRISSLDISRRLLTHTDFYQAQDLGWDVQTRKL